MDFFLLFYQVGDKCDFINPFIQKYFTEILDAHNTCFEVKAYLQSGCWILFATTITYFIGSMIIMKVCRNALYERLPNEVKDYLNNKKGEIRILHLFLLYYYYNYLLHL